MPARPTALAIATALGAGPPSLAAATQPGTLADMTLLAAIDAALGLVARFRISGPTLVRLAVPAPSADTANAAMGVFQARYPQSAWFGAVQPVEDQLRRQRRDALVAFLQAANQNATTAPALVSTDDLFDYYLIDPEMGPNSVTMRLLQASLSIQQFVQQCFLNLLTAIKVDMTDPRWSEWSWRQQFRLWQANREVFLYPENYVLPETRTNASPFFSDLENDLSQTNCDADAAQAVFENYLRKLVTVSRLVVAAHYNQVNADGSSVLHVFAHTRGNPRQWYYRTRTEIAGGVGVWVAWRQLNLDIVADQMLPVIWDRHLHLVWPIFHIESEKPSDQSIPPSGGGKAPAAQKYWAVEFAMSELSAGQWQAKKTLVERMFFVKTVSVGNLLIDRPPQGFTFKAAQQDATFNLDVSVYYNLTEIELAIALLGALFGIQIAVPGGLVATASLPMPEAPLAVTQSTALLPAASLVNLGQEPTYPQVSTANLSGNLPVPSGYNFSGQDLICGFYFQPTAGPVALNVLCQLTPNGQPATLTLLNSITNPRLVIPQQEPVFDGLDPFFVDDGNRTFLVQPDFYTVSSRPQELDNLKYISQWTTRFVFQTFYHPYARTLLRELEIGGVGQLMARNLQLNPQQVRGRPSYDFTGYMPQPPVAKPYPGPGNIADPGESALDFNLAAATLMRFTTGRSFTMRPCMWRRFSCRTRNIKTR